MLKRDKIRPHELPDKGPLTLSVVIPAVNEEVHIESAVASALQAGAMEVLVSDGGSGDRTRFLAAQRGAMVVHAPRGRAKQQNTAAARARGDILLFLHADCRLTRDCGQQIVQAMVAHPSALAGAFRQQIDDRRWIYRFLEWGKTRSLRVRWLRRPYGDQAIFIRRDWFESIGGFPDVPILEEILLLRQLPASAGLLLLPGPVIVSARRWHQAGVMGQTIRNWQILAAFRRGVPLEQLSSRYRSHDGVSDLD